MTRDRDICALCDEFSVKQADPEQAEAGIGRCLARTGTRLADHVHWNESTCVSFRLDRPNLGKRRQYIQIQADKLSLDR